MVSFPDFLGSLHPRHTPRAAFHSKLNNPSLDDSVTKVGSLRLWRPKKKKKWNPRDPTTLSEVTVRGTSGTLGPDLKGATYGSRDSESLLTCL